MIPYAAVLVDGVPVATSGTETTHTRTLDLDGAGELVVGLRPGDLSFSPGDEQVLRLTVPLLAQTLRARALAEDLIESRGQTIAAVEEERRRLRRELHDGLGPRLSGVAFTSDAARNLIRTDPAAAEAMVAQLRADTVIAIEEIRRMVYAMRPPALDELGLVPALRQQAVGLRNRDGEPVAVDVDRARGVPRPAGRGRGGGVPDRHRGAHQRGPAQHQRLGVGAAGPGRRRAAPRGDRPGPQRRLAGRGRPRLDARARHRAGRDPRGRARPGRRPGGRAAAALICSSPAGYRSGARGEWSREHVNTVAMIIVVVAVVLVIAAVAYLLVRTRGRERRTREAQELRTQAAAQSTDVDHAQREAAARQAAADQARADAELAEARPPRRSASSCRPTPSGRTPSARPTGSTRRSTTGARTTSPATSRRRASVPDVPASAWRPGPGA